MAISNEDMIQDLKQFIGATVHGEMSGMKSEIVSELRGDIFEIKIDLKNLNQKINDVDEKIDTIIDAVGEKVIILDKTTANHERRITKLESLTA